MIESVKKQPWVERVLTVVTICIILAYLIVFGIINFNGFAVFCDPDMYADTLIAKRMWEQKTIFPDPWIFGNQYYVIATPVLAAAFYGITGNTNIAMALATEVMTLFIFISFFWMFRAISRKILPTVLGCLLLISSIVAPYGVHSRFGVLFYMQASYYACYIITMFVVFGDYIRSFQSTQPRYFVWVLSLLLSFATGMQSIRQTVIMVLPILAYEFFLFLRRMLCHQRLLDKKSAFTLIRAVSYGAANAAGLVAIKLLQIPQYTIYGEFQLSSRERLADSLARVWQCFTQVSGLEFAFQPDLAPFFTLFSLILVGIVIAAALLWVKGIAHIETPLKQCWLLYLIGIAGVLLSSVLFNIKLRSIYIFMWFPLVSFSVIMVMQRLPLCSKTAAAVLVCVLSIGNLCHSFVPDACIALRDDTSDTQKMCQWALDEGYEYVYGDWSVAPYIAAYSGGSLEAGFWYDDPFHPVTYINALDIYDEEDNARAIYAFSSEDVEQGLRLALERGVELTLVAEFGEYKAYTSPVPLNRFPWD